MIENGDLDTITSMLGANSGVSLRLIGLLLGGWQHWFGLQWLVCQDTKMLLFRKGRILRSKVRSAWKQQNNLQFLGGLYWGGQRRPSLEPEAAFSLCLVSFCFLASENRLELKMLVMTTEEVWTEAGRTDAALLGRLGAFLVVETTGTKQTYGGQNGTLVPEPIALTGSRNEVLGQEPI